MLPRVISIMETYYTLKRCVDNGDVLPRVDCRVSGLTRHAGVIAVLAKQIPRTGGLISQECVVCSY